MSEKIREVSLFGKCLLASAAAHTTLLMLLIARPIWLQSVLGKTPSRSMELSLEKDTTFEVFLTKRPEKKPYDLPQKEPSLQPLSESSVLSLAEPLPLSRPSDLAWMTNNFPLVSLEEKDAEPGILFAVLPVPVSEISESLPNTAPALFFAASSALLQENEQSDQPIRAVRQTEETAPLLESVLPSNEWAAIALHPQREEPAVPLPLSTPPEYESLDLPSVAKPLSIANEPMNYASLLPAPALPIEENSDIPAVTNSAPRTEITATFEAPPLSWEEPAPVFSSNYTSPKPLLSSPSVPLNEALGFVPNFSFGNDSTPSGIRNFDLPDIASVVEWQNLFAVEVHAAPRKNEEEWLFSISLTPKKDTMAYALKQNYHFIIDCPQNAPRQRIPAYKEAVQRALEYIGSKQSFNIYILDEKGAAFAQEPVPGTATQIANAQAFLERKKHKGKKSRLDLLQVLHEIAQLPNAPDELHTIILLSDGDLMHGRKGKREEFYSWLWKQRGKIALYAASIGEEKPSLDLVLFTSASGGRVLMSPTYTGFPRRFTKLVLDLQHPLAKDVTIDLRSKNPQHPVALASDTVLPPLFAGQSYTLVGTAPAPTDFIFLLEGKSKGRYVEISKHLSLKNAAKPTSPLSSLWQKKKAQGDIVQFLNNHEKSTIEDAVKLLVQAEDR